MKISFSFAIIFVLCLAFSSESATTLEKYTAQADVIFKATALKTERQADTQIDPWFSYMEGAGSFATRFKVISVLKGEIASDEVLFRHYRDLKHGMTTRVFFTEKPLPVCYEFRVGENYLLWAAKTDDGNLRQISKAFTKRGDCIHVGDNAPVQGDIKNVLWDEYLKMAQGTKLSNISAGLSGLRWLCGATLRPTDVPNKNPDFPLARFADVAIPLLDSPNEIIAWHALASLGGNTAKLAQAKLLMIANGHANLGMRGVALQWLRDIKTPEVQEVALHALSDFPPSVTRENAVTLQSLSLYLLSDFPSRQSRLLWRAYSSHPQERVRHSVAQAIGVVKDGTMSDILLKMVDDSDNYVRESAVRSLLGLPVRQGLPIWKKLRSHKRYGPYFINALAVHDPKPYLNALMGIVNHQVRGERILNYKIDEPEITSWKLLFDHISKMPKMVLEDAPLSHILDVLEYRAVNPKALYRLYRIKKMEKRAVSYSEYLNRTRSGAYKEDFKAIDREFTKP